MMNQNLESSNSLWGFLIIEELIRCGVEYFCISPGSRSTPLTAAVAGNQRASHIICFDERGCSFHALGYSRATGKAAAVITTSGTAAANCFPAVIEASNDNVPLILLTADRPPELQQTGANQTIDQVKLFGSYCRWESDLPCPDEKINPCMVVTTIDQAVYRTLRAPTGPVHINCMFREPLAPEIQSVNKKHPDPLTIWRDSSEPYTRYVLSEMKPNEQAVAQLSTILNETDKGILAVGTLYSEPEIAAVTKLSELLNWPVWADVSSGLRLGSDNRNVIPYFDQLMLSEKIRRTLPRTVLHMGGRIVSKRFLQLLESEAIDSYIVVNNHPSRQDPSHAVTLRVETGIPLLVNALTPLIKAKNENNFALLREKSNLLDPIFNEITKHEMEITEPSAARLLSHCIYKGSGLFLANSMPVRDMDMYAEGNGERPTVGVNRGTSGIDGTIACACGFAAGLNAPVTLLTGDLAFIHDMNSLALLSILSQPVIVIVINNQGGGIFSFLPIAEFTDIFEPYFGTPHRLQFKDAASMFGIDYYYPKTNSSLLEAYQSAQQNGRSAIIEIRTDRKSNASLHKQLQEKITSILER